MLDAEQLKAMGTPPMTDVQRPYRPIVPEGTLIVGDTLDKAIKYAQACGFDPVNTFCRGKESSLAGYRACSIIVIPGTRLDPNYREMLKTRLHWGGKIFNMDEGTVFNLTYV